jgi:hypothetical protein
VNKAQLLELVQDMPEDIDPEELMYRIYLLQKVQAGEDAVASGDTFSHDEAVRISDEWPK